MKLIALLCVLFSLSTFAAQYAKDLRIENPTLLKEFSGSATPTSGYGQIYFKSSDKKLYQMDSLGAESVVGGGGFSPSNLNALYPLVYTADADSATLTLGYATSLVDGALSATDWSMFNNKVGQTQLTASVSAINSSISLKKNDLSALTLEETGWVDPSLVSIAYDNSTRRATITHTTTLLSKGQVVSTIPTGWISDAHSAAAGVYYLSYDPSTGTASWSSSVWSFDKAQIMIANCQTTYCFGISEQHSITPWQVHRHQHQTVGSYFVSGADLSDFALSNSASKTPNVSATVIADEDIQHSLPALTNKLYTQFSLVGAGATASMTTDRSTLIPTSGNQPYFNEFTGGAWQQTLLSNNNYMALWLVAIPTTSSTNSQKFRYIWMQGQRQSNSLATIQALTPQDTSLGTLSSQSPEFVFVGKLIIQYTAGNWSIVSAQKLTGSKFSQTAVSGGTYLSSVTTDSTLTGAGTAADPLHVVAQAASIDTQHYSTRTATSSVSGELGLYKYLFTQTASKTGTVFSVTSSTTLPLAGYPDGIVAYWNMDGASGAGEVNQYQAGTYNLSQAGTTGTATGKFSSSRGTGWSSTNNLYWSSGASSGTAFDAQNFIVGCWVKYTSNQNYARFGLSKTTRFDSNGWEMIVGYTANWHSGIAVNGTYAYKPVAAYDTTTWHLEVGHRNTTQNTLQYYYDAVKQTDAANAGSWSASTDNLEIGFDEQFGGTEDFYLDDCFYISGTYTTAQVQALNDSIYNSGAGRLISQASSTASGTSTKFTMLKDGFINYTMETKAVNTLEAIKVWKNGILYGTGTPSAASSASITKSGSIYGVTNDYFEFGSDNKAVSNPTIFEINGMQK